MTYLNGEVPDGDLDTVLANRGVVSLAPMKSGNWVRVPGLFRLRLSGTGTVTIDAGNSAGEITEAVEVYTMTAEGDARIDFPFFGTDVTHLRATITGTAHCEVM
ncbi:MAG TPA: hypothetical protein VF503_20295 [Sphingobium sp.]|uniref:hypothetical protein n=1 Tax=Sphingobium sp. TaxID=1912891 RepID=UPI002ED48BFA